MTSHGGEKRALNISKDVLLKMLKQEKRRVAEGEVALKEAGLPPLRPISPILGRTSPHAMNLLPSPHSKEQATAMKASLQLEATVPMETRTSVESTKAGTSFQGMPFRLTCVM